MRSLRVAVGVCRLLAVIAAVLAWLVTLGGCLFAGWLTAYFVTVFLPPAAFVTACFVGTWPFLIPVVLFGLPWLLGRRHVRALPGDLAA